MSELTISQPFTVSPDVTCREAVDILTGQGFDQVLNLDVQMADILHTLLLCVEFDEHAAPHTDT